MASNVLIICALIGTSTMAWADIDPETALKTCMATQSDAPQPVKKKDGTAKYMLKGLGQELGSNAKGMAEGMVFVFSAQDIDPYDKKAPKDKPYTMMTIALVDGTTCSIVKYPDNSKKVVGGFADGTIIAPLTANTFVVGYPNGARGKLVGSPGGNYKIYRPDNTVTTFQKTMSGRYTIRNDQGGYMGEAVPDRTGLSYEFSRPL
jgi:hypothetical protein